MALLDFLKNKKDKERAQVSKAVKKPAAKKAEKVSVEKKEAEKAPAEKPKAAPKITSKTVKGFSFTIIKEPHISEKASNLAADSKYTFKVNAGANKQEIAKSIEGIYGVSVVDVNVIKIPPKKRRLGRTEGFKKAYTKAVVTLKKGQTIELF